METHFFLFVALSYQAYASTEVVNLKKNLLFFLFVNIKFFLPGRTMVCRHVGIKQIFCFFNLFICPNNLLEFVIYSNICYSNLL